MNPRAIEREVPVYREAFPNLCGSEIKLLSVRKSSV